MKEEQVILVDAKDNQIGIMEKLEAHKKGLLHRAISVFIYNSNGEMLIQRRALEKYHSKGLWANTCCSHPFPGESSLEAANRRLQEEMGMKANLQEIFSFTYKSSLDNGLTEHELDHVFLGTTDTIPEINKDEVSEWKYTTHNDLTSDIEINPEKYAVWFKMIFEKVNQKVREIS